MIFRKISILIYIFSIVLIEAIASDVIQLPNYPDRVRNYWAKNVQGIAHDKNNIFITNTDSLTRYPSYLPLEWLDVIPASATQYVNIPTEVRRKGYYHFGDPDIYEEHIYVPIEGPKPFLIARYKKKDLSFDGIAQLPESVNSAPWLAIDKTTGVLYTSSFDLSSKNHIHGFYIVETDDGFKLELAEKFHLQMGPSPIYLQRIQGAAFNEDASWAVFVCDHKAGGLFFFNWKTKRFFKQQRINYSPGFPFYHELEGVTVWNEAASIAPFMEGNIHVFMLDNNLFDRDKASLLHYDYLY